MHNMNLIFSAALIVLVTIFALTNNTPITVKFLGFAEWETSVTVVILAGITGGVMLRSLLDFINKITQGHTNDL